MPHRQEAQKPRRLRDSKAWSPVHTRSPTTPRLADEPSPATMASAAQETLQDAQSENVAATGRPDSETIDKLRKRMKSTLALQSSHAQQNPSPEPPLQEPKGLAMRRINAELQAPAHAGSDCSVSSPNSSETVKEGGGGLSGTVRTPSFPFPRMGLRLPTSDSQLSVPRHKPFTILSGNDGPVSTTMNPALPETSLPDAPSPASRLRLRSLSTKEEPPDDPNYPPPDLYDLVLLLNSEAGSDAWWANVTEVLAEAYGAERASLAVPGDMTDLENIPWGQKATFNLAGLESVATSAAESVVPPEKYGARSHGKLMSQRNEEISFDIRQAPQAPSNPRRPRLESRHSIAGMAPDTVNTGLLQRPGMPVRALSGRVDSVSSGANQIVVEDAPGSSAIHEDNILSPGTIGPPSTSAASEIRATVHAAPHPLESETDPLIVRTGVTSLFGKRHPVVMTRSLNERSASPSFYALQDRSRTDDSASSSSRQSHSSLLLGSDPAAKKLSSLKSWHPPTYAEYEQPEPSPWSNSPHPSPAPRIDTTESPFFAQSAHVDEAAFDPDMSGYDYSTSQPVEAIGTDSAKTLIHIPLIQPVPSRRPLSSTLRFPIAIISMLTSINPYPLSLRHSLTALQPHLATSYSLAQQFSSLEVSAHDRSLNRHGHPLGLGGTFSDVGSELELMTELGNQISRGQGEELRRSAHGSVASPSERSPLSRASPAEYSFPSSANTGFTPGLPITPGRSGAEMVDSYFSAKRQRSAGLPQNGPATPYGYTVHRLRDSSAEEAGERNKARGPSAQAQASGRLWNPPSSRSSSVLSSPYPENAPDVLSKVPTQLGMGEAEQQDFAGPRGHPAGPPNGTSPRDLGDRSLPGSVSQLLLNSVPLQLFLAKPRTGELVWTNSKFDAFRTQAQPEGTRTKDPWQNTHDADRQTISQKWTHALRTGAQMTQHVRVKRFSDDNDYRWFIFRANPLLASTGQLTYWIGSFLDVHDQHVAEMRATEERDTLLRNARYQALANSIPQVLFEAVENVGIVSTNEQWHTFSGQSLEEALNLGFTKHVHRDDLEKCGIVAAVQNLEVGALSHRPSSMSSLSTTMSRTQSPQTGADALSLTSLVQKGIVTIEHDENGRISYSTEIRLRSRGGEFRWFLVRLVKVESDLLNGGQASWYGTCTDIHDRRALEEELSRVNQRMQLEMESKTKFFANMSHEIRTPLNGILGSIPWLVESGLEPDQRRTIDTIQNSSNNLRELVDNILDVTKVEAGKMTLTPKWFHLRTLIEEVIDTVASRAIDKGLQLNYTLNSDVPPMVKGDAFRLRQILINLMGNAVKFTDEGEVYTSCYVRELPNDEEVNSNAMQIAFNVVDTGRGFSKLEFQRLFKQFGQTGGSSSHDAGSGLGLFLSRQLVELLGGQLLATSEVDEGSTFSFYIQVEVPAGDVPPSPSTECSEITRPNYGDSSQAGSPASREVKNALAHKTHMHSPGVQKIVASPETQSPAALPSSGSSNPSLRSLSGHQTDRSSMSSVFLPTENVKLDPSSLRQNSKTSEGDKSSDSGADSSSTGGSFGGSEGAPSSRLKPGSSMLPTTYSIAVLCSGRYARAAIKQHIEKVVPYQFAVNVTTLDRTEQVFELLEGARSPVFTHVVVDLPISHDLVRFVRRMLDFKAAVVPALVVVTDHYQKRDVADEFVALSKRGQTVTLVQKPVKPCIFSLIFDPSQQRKLSRDRNRDMAQSVTEDFRNVAERVKKVLSGKGHRILVVDDSEVNRLVSHFRFPSTQSCR